MINVPKLMKVTGIDLITVKKPFFLSRVTSVVNIKKYSLLYLFILNTQTFKWLHHDITD